ncbi:UDP binding domain-containing protein [Streptomyces sp. PU-14G]|uniref:UDP binding domain-containing protein n=1 Tax=Streptomyces sp. PU-14G TaxID=2800808 RepID=UPI0034DF37F8
MLPYSVARRVQVLLNSCGLPLREARVLLICITYKADNADQRESPANDLAARLSDQGAELAYHDPHVPEWILRGEPVPREQDVAAAATAADVVVVLQHHSAVDLGILADSGTLVLDTRGKPAGGGLRGCDGSLATCPTAAPRLSMRDITASGSCP